MLVFEERGKPEYPEKNLSEQGREPTTNSTHIWHRRRDLNPGHMDGRRALSPLRHPCSPEQRFLIKPKGENEKAKAKRKQLTYYEGNNDKYINVVIL